MTRKFQTNYVICRRRKQNWRIYRTHPCVNRFGPNTMTCSNVSVKQYWYFRYFIKVPNGPRSRRDEPEGTGRERWERGRNVVPSGFIALWVRVLSIIDLVAKVEAIHLPRILLPRSPRKSELLSDKIGRFNFKMEERERCHRKSVR